MTRRMSLSLEICPQAIFAQYVHVSLTLLFWKERCHGKWILKPSLPFPKRILTHLGLDKEPVNRIITPLSSVNHVLYNNRPRT